MIFKLLLSGFLSILYAQWIELNKSIASKHIRLYSDNDQLYPSLRNTLTAMALIIYIGERIKAYVAAECERYRRLFSNTKPLKRLYTRTLSHLKFTILDNLINPPSLLGIFVAAIQYFTLGRIVNVIVSFLNVILSCILTEIAMVNDRKILAEGISRRYHVQGGSQSTPMNSLQVGMEIVLRKDELIPAPECILISTTPALFNVQANNGEQNTYRLFHLHETLTSDLVYLNEAPCTVRIVKVYNSYASGTDNFTAEIIAIQTKVSFVMYFVVFIMMQMGTGNSTEISIVALLMDLLSTLVLFNYLIPQMKTLPVSVIRMLVMLLYSARNGVITVSSDSLEHCDDPYLDTQLSSQSIIVVSDKTGTLTQNRLSIHAHKIHDFGKAIRSINSGFVMDGQIYANSPEEREIARLYQVEYKQCLPRRPRIWGEMQTLEGITALSLDFNTQNYGRHVLYRETGTETQYHVIQFQSEQLALVCDQEWEAQSPHRSLMIVGRETSNFEQSIAEYVNCVKQGAKLPGASILAEFYFSDPLRTGSIEGFSLLAKQRNVSFFMCTGDSLTTAEYIGRQIGMRDFELSTECCIRSGDDNPPRELVFAKIGSLQKRELVRYLREKYPRHLIMMFGDQKNDEQALVAAQYSFVQSEGCLDCQIAARCKVEDLRSVYHYLFNIRRLRIYGQYWLLSQFHVFNCIMCAISLMAVFVLGFNKNGIVYLDPWNPVFTIVLTNIIAAVLILTSFKIGQRCSQTDLNPADMASHRTTLKRTWHAFASSLVLAWFLHSLFMPLSGNLVLVFLLSSFDSVLAWF